MVRAQARELTRLGHDVRVITGSEWTHSGRDVLRGDVEGVPVAYLPRAADENGDITLERPRIAELIMAEARDLDLVHVHHWSTLSGDLVRRLATIAPVAVTLHDFFVACRAPTAARRSRA